VLLTYDTGWYSPVIARETPTFVSETGPLMPVISSTPAVEVGETLNVPEALMPPPLNEKLSSSATAADANPSAAANTSTARRFPFRRQTSSRRWSWLCLRSAASPAQTSK
jgi:hypothetical protein